MFSPCCSHQTSDIEFELAKFEAIKQSNETQQPFCVCKEENKYISVSFAEVIKKDYEIIEVFSGLPVTT